MPIDAPETQTVTTWKVSCDGGEGALGHPRVWLEIDERGYVDCGYCDRRFILVGTDADHAPGDISEHGEDALGR